MISNLVCELSMTQWVKELAAKSNDLVFDPQDPRGGTGN